MKIAIYSGEVPSTTFIERLIIGLSKAGLTIYLFGSVKKKIDYPPNVIVSVYQGRLSKFCQWLKWTFILNIFRKKDKQKLDKILRLQTSAGVRLAQLKAYPVLWYRPDVVHIQWAKSLEEWMWVQHFGIKLVLSLRGAHINYSPLANPKLTVSYRRNFPKVDAFHAVSEAIGKEAQKYGAAAEKIKIIYSGLDLSQFEPFGKTNYQPNKPFTILSVGRFHWIKGYHLALDAFSLLAQEGVPFKYNIIAGKANEELIFQINDLKLTDNVTILDSMTSENVYRHMQQADMLLIPSLKEGLANVALEAMALGLPVLSSNEGGMDEIIEHNKNGWLFKTLNTNDLAEKILQAIISTLEERQKIVVQARADIEQQHQVDRMISQMIELYDTCA